MADTSRVVLTLAHPFTAEQARQVGADPKQYQVGDEMTVPAGYAMAVINAGQAQVNPSDAAAVAKALTVHPDDGTGNGGPANGAGQAAGNPDTVPAPRAAGPAS